METRLVILIIMGVVTGFGMRIFIDYRKRKKQIQKHEEYQKAQKDKKNNKKKNKK